MVEEMDALSGMEINVQTEYNKNTQNTKYNDLIRCQQFKTVLQLIKNELNSLEKYILSKSETPKPSD